LVYPVHNCYLKIKRSYCCKLILVRISRSLLDFGSYLYVML
jgi:hypothetical protein